MKSTVVILSIAAWFFVAASPAFAEKANMSPDQLRTTATHVVVGKVLGIYQRVVKEPNWTYTHLVAEIQINECEKGDDLSQGGLVYARYWRRQFTGKGNPPPSTSGHRGLPEESQSVRVYLAKNAYDGFSDNNNDGGFNVIGANGFEVLKPDAQK